MQQVRSLNDLDGVRTCNSHEDWQVEHEALRELSCAICCLDVTYSQGPMAHPNNAWMIDLMQLDEKPETSMHGFLGACQKLVSGATINPERKRKKE